MKVLVADDDLTTAEFVRKGLVEAGYTVDVVHDGRDALSHCLYVKYDLIVLDRMMPHQDGLSVLKALRAAKVMTPTLFLTSLVGIEERVEGLMAGADDYLVKPFHFSELLARLVVLGRRTQGEEKSSMLKVHDLELDLLSRVATRAGKRIELLAKEFALLEVLMRNAGHVVTKTMLLEQVWNLSFDPQTSVIETHISRLRSKIDRPFDVALLHTMRNSGYSLQAP